MSREKGKVVRPLTYLTPKAGAAIEDKLIPELRKEILHSELSPDKAWREAKRRLMKLRTTADLSKEDQELASSYWALAKLKRDYPGLEVKYLNPKKEGKEMDKKIRVDFLGATEGFDDSDLIAVINSLQEKHGLMIKICGNCEHCKKAAVDDRPIREYYCCYGLWSDVRCISLSETCGIWSLRRKTDFDKIEFFTNRLKAREQIIREKTRPSRSGPQGG